MNAIDRILRDQKIDQEKNAFVQHLLLATPPSAIDKNAKHAFIFTVYNRKGLNEFKEAVKNLQKKYPGMFPYYSEHMEQELNKFTKHTEIAVAINVSIFRRFRKDYGIPIEGDSIDEQAGNN